MTLIGYPVPYMCWSRFIEFSRHIAEGLKSKHYCDHIVLIFATCDSFLLWLRVLFSDLRLNKKNIYSSLPQLCPFGWKSAHGFLYVMKDVYDTSSFEFTAKRENCVFSRQAIVCFDKITKGINCCKICFILVLRIFLKYFERRAIVRYARYRWTTL